MGKVLKNRLKQQKFVNEGQEAFLNIMITANFLRSKIDKLCGEFGITFPQYNVLRILNGVYPDGHPRCEIIERMIEPAPDVTRILDKLIDERLVERFISNEDRRLSIARITPKGIELINKMEPTMRSMDKFFIEKVSKNELLEISAILEKIYSTEK